MSGNQIQAIKFALVSCFGPDAEVWLFGPRTDDAKRGGDIDLLVKHVPVGEDVYKPKVRFQVQLE